MATGALAGKNGKVTVAGSVVADVSNWTASYITNTADTPSFSSSGYMERIPTLIEFNGTFNSDSFINTQGSTSGIFQVNTSWSATKPKISGGIIINDVGINTDVTDAVRYTYTFESTGTMTITAA